MTTEVIWREYAIEMKSYISRQIPDENTAEDILQNVFLKIHSDVNQIQRIGNLQAWLYRTTKNTMIDYFRSKKFNSELDEKYTEDEKTEDTVEHIAKSIRFFIKKLDEPFRQVMILSELKQMSQKEIAKKLNSPYSTIKSRVQKGRELVKKMMLDCCHYEFDRRGNVIDYECRKC